MKNKWINYRLPTKNKKKVGGTDFIYLSLFLMTLLASDHVAKCIATTVPRWKQLTRHVERKGWVEIYKSPLQIKYNWKEKSTFVRLLKTVDFKSTQALTKRLGMIHVATFSGSGSTGTIYYASEINFYLLKLKKSGSHSIGKSNALTWWISFLAQL